MSDWLGALTNRSNVMAGRVESEKDRKEREKDRQNAKSDKTIERLMGLFGDYQTQQNFNRQQTEAERAQAELEGLNRDKFGAERTDELTRISERGEDYQRADKAEETRVSEADRSLFLKYGLEFDEYGNPKKWNFDPNDPKQWPEPLKITDAYFNWMKKIADENYQTGALRDARAARAASGDKSQDLVSKYSEAVGQVISHAVGIDPEKLTQEHYLEVFARPELMEGLKDQFERALNMNPDLYGTHTPAPGETLTQAQQVQAYNRQNAIDQFASMLNKKEVPTIVIDPDPNKTKREGFGTKVWDVLNPVVSEVTAGDLGYEGEVNEDVPVGEPGRYDNSQRSAANAAKLGAVDTRQDDAAGAFDWQSDPDAIKTGGISELLNRQLAFGEPVVNNNGAIVDSITKGSANVVDQANAADIRNGKVTGQNIDYVNKVFQQIDEIDTKDKLFLGPEQSAKDSAMGNLKSIADKELSQTDKTSIEAAIAAVAQNPGRETWSRLDTIIDMVVQRGKYK